MLSEVESRRLPDKLCVEIGFCLPPETQQRLMESPPVDALLLADAVFIEEGLDPSTAERHLYRQVRDMIADSFRRAGHDGANPPQPPTCRAGEHPQDSGARARLAAEQRRWAEVVSHGEIR